MEKGIRKLVAILTLGMAAMILASCQFAPVLPKSLIFQSALFEPQDMTRRAGKNGFGRLQFISARTAPHRAIIVHIEADELSVISESLHHSRIFLRTWTELKDTDLKFGDEYFLQTSVGEIRYERFSIAGVPCFQFYRLFNRSNSDDMVRERSIIAGYYCNETGPQPGMDEMANFLQGVRLERTDSWNSVPREDTSDLFAPKRRLFEVRVRAADGPTDWVVP